MLSAYVLNYNTLSIELEIWYPTIILGLKIIIGIAIMIVVAGIAIGLGFGLYNKSNESTISTTITTTSTTTTPSPFANVTICNQVGCCNVSCQYCLCYS